jgi:hypothetical protein
MGLDAYVFATESTTIPDKGAKEIAYFRKHNRLQGFMENLYRAKGGAEEFNCVPVVLTLEDIKTLEHAIKGKALPATSGFFFGNDSYGYKGADGEYEYFKDDLKLIKDARKCLKEGKTVYYYSWW